MILITGAAGFIGSCLIAELNNRGFTDLLLSDSFNKPGKKENLLEKKYTSFIDREDLMLQNDSYFEDIECIFHLGARTDTTSQDTKIFQNLNLEYSIFLWGKASKLGIPFYYASSAATYGKGEHGYNDYMENLNQLSPLNAYAISKHQFDLFTHDAAEMVENWAGFKFFNVYGPNEYHKGRMASVVFHSYHQIMKEGKVSLFKSHHPDYNDGGQLRDFIYVKDIIDILIFSWQNKIQNGIYNAGTGRAASFADLVSYVFLAMDKEVNIEYIDMPEDISANYQYYTCANMEKLLEQKYTNSLSTIKEGVFDYVKNYLINELYM